VRIKGAHVHGTARLQDGDRNTRSRNQARPTQKLRVHRRRKARGLQEKRKETLRLRLGRRKGEIKRETDVKAINDTFIDFFLIKSSLFCLICFKTIHSLMLKV